MAASGKKPASEWQRVAWAGFSLDAPPDWRPILIEGEWRKGSLVLGDAERVVLKVTWRRPGGKWFDAGKQLRRRLRRAIVAPAEVCPRPEGFETVACSVRPDKEGPGDLWCGHSAGAGLYLELVLSSELGEKMRRRVLSRVVPSLRATAPDAPTAWAFFDAVFETPPGFALLERRLVLGDLSLLVGETGPRRRGVRRRLLVRQVYPAEVAVSRRTIEKWLDSSPFGERRILKADAAAEDWSFEHEGRTLAGKLRTGRKAFKLPFGRIAARLTAACAVVDQGRERLLVAEYDWPAAGRGGAMTGPEGARREGEAVLVAAVRGMIR